MKTYYHEYAHKNHAKWLRVTHGITPSPLGVNVANILGYVGGGLYNCPIDIRKIDWTNTFCIRVYWRRYLCNFDDFSLSRLWVLCHRNMVRVEIDAAEMATVPGEFSDPEDAPEKVPVLTFLFHQRGT
ncbi:MAG: hypothetical protein ABFC24_08675, partial [Methanoregulaceae archaeon]